MSDAEFAAELGVAVGTIYAYRVSLEGWHKEPDGTIVLTEACAAAIRDHFTPKKSEGGPVVAMAQIIDSYANPQWIRVLWHGRPAPLRVRNNSNLRPGQKLPVEALPDGSLRCLHPQQRPPA